METLDDQLITASRDGDVETVEQLIKAGADVHADNDYALQLASCNGHTAVVKLLRRAAQLLRQAMEETNGYNR